MSTATRTKKIDNRKNEVDNIMLDTLRHLSKPKLGPTFAVLQHRPSRTQVIDNVEILHQLCGKPNTINFVY